jgi:hypothetical protein
MRALVVWLEVHGAKMDRTWVENLLKGMTRNGRVAQRTSVRKALITWRAPDRGA